MSNISDCGYASLMPPLPLPLTPVWCGLAFCFLRPSSEFLLHKFTRPDRGEGINSKNPADLKQEPALDLIAPFRN